MSPKNKKVSTHISSAIEEKTLNATLATFNPHASMRHPWRRLSAINVTVLLWIHTKCRKGIPVHGVAVMELARKHTIERECHSSVIQQKQQLKGEHHKEARERIAVLVEEGGSPEPHRCFRQRCRLEHGMGPGQPPNQRRSRRNLLKTEFSSKTKFRLVQDNK
jgi:hypothetical protein